jgi:putative DNA primase/helicase
VLGEIFGYMLTADTSQRKIFLLVGPTRGGKGTIGRVLTMWLARPWRASQANSACSH